jgi:2-C-methyl-D-erythritol 4-phosphate cytidylyltransferase
VIVVVPADRVKTLAPLKKKYNIAIVAGGRERFDSVRAGLAALQPGIAYVAIHDGARPLVSPGLIRKALVAARSSGAAVVAIPARDTVKLSAEGHWVDNTAPRTHVWLAQTPQVFRRTLIETAYARLKTDRLTDDAQVAEQAGIRVRIVPGETTNIKITEPGDLQLAQLFAGKKGCKRGTACT